MTTKNQKNDSIKTISGKKPLPFMKYKWPFLFVSIFFVLLSFYEIFVLGINFGVDFVGGTKALYKFDTQITSENIKDAVKSTELGNIEVVKFGQNTNSNEFILRVKYFENKDVVGILSSQFEKSFGKEKFSLQSQEGVGPKAGADMRRNGYFSIILTCLLIVVYIGFRFDFLFAPGAIIALAHDVIISVGFFSLLQKEFNLPILAAVLTILGYSINDTIVIYDRIRENILRLPKSTSQDEIINISLTETLSRTLITALTTLIVVVVMFFIGGGVLHDFSLCLIIGITFGAYSSIFIASPIYIALHKLFPDKGLKAQLEKPV